MNFLIFFILFFQTNCPGDWLTEYRTLFDPFPELMIQPENKPDTISDKVTDLYMMRFNLILLRDSAPDCSKQLTAASIYVVQQQAEYGMLLTLQDSGTSFTDEEMEILTQNYDENMADGMNILEMASD